MIFNQSLSQSVDTVLFDLDGTLLDTHLDLVAALNTVLVNHDKAPLPADQLRPFVSKGAMVMVCLAFRCSPKSDEARQRWLEMLDAYETDIARHTVLFPGMEQVLEKRRKAPRKPRAKRPDIPADHVDHVADMLRKRFGTGVRITPCQTLANGKKAKGTVAIDFYSSDDLDRILAMLGISGENEL